jgi:hypothetical protein
VTGRAAAIQGGLAALGLITASFTWQREPERAPGEVSVLDASKNDLGRVHYEDDATAVDLERRRDGQSDGQSGKDGAEGGGVWVHLVEKAGAKPPLPKRNAPKNEPPAGPAPPRDLRGSEAAEKLLDQFAPLRSPRAFGVLDAAKLKELGLDAPKKKLTITAKGDTREYTIGQPPGSTTGETYLRDGRDGRVYLMPHGMITDLQASATRLVDRKMHSFDPTDFDKLTLSVGGKTRELVQTHRENAHLATLASAKTPDKPDQMAKNWNENLWRSFPLEVLGKGEVPKDGSPTLVARVDYFDGKKPLGWIEIAKPPAPVIEESSPATNAPPALFVRTERTAGWVKIRANPQLVSDAEKLAASP